MQQIFPEPIFFRILNAMGGFEEIRSKIEGDKCDTCECEPSEIIRRLHDWFPFFDPVDSLVFAPHSIRMKRITSPAESGSLSEFVNLVHFKRVATPSFVMASTFWNKFYKPPEIGSTGTG
jgi:hypothetical protein